MHRYPRFLYCQNELSGTDEYVLHTAMPRFLARKLHDGADNKFDIVWVDPPPSACDADRLIQLMDDLNSWYQNYTAYLSSTAGYIFAGN